MMDAVKNMAIYQYFDPSMRRAPSPPDLVDFTG